MFEVFTLFDDIVDGSAKNRLSIYDGVFPEVGLVDIFRYAAGIGDVDGALQIIDDFF
ncbi:hypothetical protein ABK905_10785 [Acerihabitans sp. KWT182]|uniref:Uncharacterized protein n=1 Tax=Acerihabitans sp. KWT182 TaxID=3157919 RepID=A0AAU7QE07_9GAMM